MDRLAFSDAEDRLDRLVAHPALGGPDLTFVHARLAHQRGDVDFARKLVQESLQELPGDQGFLAFATEIGASPHPQATRGEAGPVLVAGVSDHRRTGSQP